MVVEARLILPFILAANDSTKVLTFRSAGVDVDGIVVQAVHSAGQIDHLLVNCTSTPTGTEVGKTHVVFATGYFGTCGNLQIRGAIISNGNSLILKVVRHRTEIHPLALGEILIGLYSPSLDATDEAIGGFQLTTIGTFLGAGFLWLSINCAVL